MYNVVAIFRKDPAASLKFEGGWKGRRKAAFLHCRERSVSLQDNHVAGPAPKKFSLLL